MNQVVEQTQRSNAFRERIEVVDTVPILDTSRFEHMQRIANVMAHSSMMPESLYMTGKANEKMRLPHEQIMSNCFLVVNQALRWGLDPFAVAQCVSVVHGKLCYEGKLVSAVLQAKLDRNLHHHFTGSGDDMRVYLSDERFTDEIIKELKPGYRRQDMRIFDGSVNEWKTTGANSPWSPKNFTRMLIYRGTRDWCRIYEPALMLGIYTDDEMEDMSEHTRARELRDITPSKPSLMDRLRSQQEASQATTSEREGFDPSFVQSETDATLQGDVIDAETNSNTDEEPPLSTSVDADAAASVSEAGDDPSPHQSPASNPIPKDVLVHFKDYARKALEIAGDQAMAVDDRFTKIETMLDNYRDVIPDDLWPQLAGMDVAFKAVVDGARTIDQARSYIAEVLECSEKEIGG
jgi:hypothetical protein